jgi:chaperonin GroEL (HSP60 family)
MWSSQRDAIQNARWLTDYVGSSLGPNGLGKILMKSSDDFVITNDGLLMLEKEPHSSPAEEILVEMAKSMKTITGDGSKSMVILACELLSRAEALLDRGAHPNIIIREFNKSAAKAIKILQGIGKPLDVSDADSVRKAVEAILSPRLSGKENLTAFTSAIVEAVRFLSQTTPSGNLPFNANDILVKGIIGGVLSDTKFVDGIIIDKEVEPGSERSLSGARIALLRASLEIEKTEWDMEINLADPGRIGALLDDESKIILDKWNRIISSGANAVFCERGIDPLLRQYLSEKKILAARWIEKEDMNRLAKATGGTVVADIYDLSANDLGSADRVAEQDYGGKKRLAIQGCKDPKTVTILVRGPTESIIEEAKRSILQALRSLEVLFKDPRFVFGGGAIEAELATQLRKYATGLGGNERAAAATFADALDSIPVSLIRNSGGEVLDILTSLRSRHQMGELSIGIDASTGSLMDIADRGVIEPLMLKTRVIEFASEAAGTILSVDDTISPEHLEESEKKRTEKDNTEYRVSAQEALNGNIQVAKHVAELIKKSLGPNGMMKLMVDNIGDNRTTSDGATMLKFLYAQHPIAKLLVDAADFHSQNSGDGAKTLVILTGELLSHAETLLAQGVSLHTIRESYSTLATLATDEFEKLSRGFDLDDQEMLRKVIRTVMQDNAIQSYSVNKTDGISGKISGIVLDAFREIQETYCDKIAENFDLRKMKIVKKIGSGLSESRLVDGYIIDKEVSSDEMPKRAEKAKIAVLDYWLGITRQTFRRETRIQVHNPAALREYLDSASKLAKQIAERINSTGASVIFCSKRTDDVVKRVLTTARIMVVEGVSSDDLQALCELTGAIMISDQAHLNANCLGEADLVEEQDIHGSKLVFVEGCPYKGNPCVLIRGATSSVADETERILQKTIRTLIELSKNPRTVPGGGLGELYVAGQLRKKSREIGGREQLVTLAYSSALESIPRTLYENAGLDSLETLLRTRNEASGSFTDSTIWDPYPQKRQVILNATNTANVILKLGHIIKNKNKKPDENEPLRKSQENSKAH